VIRREPVSYDRVPYPSLSYSQCHPDRLATVATLMGMKPAPVEGCRMLELGCAGGGNLIPIAYTLPGSKFVGIDLSARQIAEGRTVVEKLGLQNIELKHLDILDVDADLGSFDYIVAHGVYTWVPEPVRDKLLQIYARHLAPQGVGYISYNVYPGWHMLSIVRDIMLYRTRNIPDPEEKVAQGRAFLNLLADSGPGEGSVYGAFLKSYVQVLEEKLDDKMPRHASLLLHDELEADNRPVYFYEFAERAAHFGLQYLGEALLSDMVRAKVPLELRTAVDEVATSLVEMEQYLDFLQNRTFRQSLVCHQDVTLSYDVDPELVMGLYAASGAQPETPEADVHSVSVVKFEGRDGAVLSIDHPISKAAMLCLAERWPASLPFGELLAAARARLGQGDPLEGDGTPENGEDIDALVLATNLLRAYGYSDTLAELHAYAPAFARQASERPVAAATVRYQVQDGGPITNLRHERMTPGTFDRYLLQHLDGSCDRAALVDLLLAGPVAEGLLTVQHDDGGGQKREMADLLAEEVDRRIRLMANAALLVA
jgi:methyltransferase-like protein/SAM-dependent methyltransferase